MLATRLLLLSVSTACVGTAILEDAGQTDLKADSTQLEKTRRSLSQNDFDLLTLQVKELLLLVEELKRKSDQKDNNGYNPSIVIIMKDTVDIGRIYSRSDNHQSGSATLVTVMEYGQVIYVEEYPGHEVSTGGPSMICDVTLEHLAFDNVSGTTYIRWGRTVCSGNDTELAYKGYMAGSEFTNTGSGPNHLCLPEDPTWAKYQDGNADPEYRSHVYGTEYEMGVHGDFTPFSGALLRNDAPCAVCRTPRSASIIIPGRTNCYSGRTAEYSGYLVSTYYRHAASSEYVCLDGDPEPVASGAGHQSGHLLYLVDVICGTLPCPPYVNGRELACVVCSK